MLIQEEIWDEADIIRYPSGVQRQVSLAKAKLKRMKSVDAERGRGPLSPGFQQPEVRSGVLSFVVLFLCDTRELRYNKTLYNL